MNAMDPVDKAALVHESSPPIGLKLIAKITRPSKPDIHVEEPRCSPKRISNRYEWADEIRKSGKCEVNRSVQFQMLATPLTPSVFGRRRRLPQVRTSQGRSGDSIAR
jgi:hypothetical protein